MNKISPEEYRKVLDFIELKNIYLTDITANINHDIFPNKANVSINDEASFSITEDGFVIINKYSLLLKKDRRIALKIVATYRIHFTSPQKITEDFFDIYKNVSLPLNIWPFFRELVNTVTSKMNIPPLILPLLKR